MTPLAAFFAIAAAFAVGYLIGVWLPPDSWAVYRLSKRRLSTRALQRALDFRLSQEARRHFPRSRQAGSEKGRI